MSPKKPSRAPGPRSSARTSSQIKGARRSSTAMNEVRDLEPRIAGGRDDEVRGGATADKAEAGSENIRR